MFKCKSCEYLIETIHEHRDAINALFDYLDLEIIPEAEIKKIQVKKRKLRKGND